MKLPRRRFLAASAWAALGNFGFLTRLPSVSAAEATLQPATVRLDSGIEPLVRLLEETPREKVLEEVASRIKRGLTYREVLTALFLAGVRNIQPRPVGFKFHAVLVVNSAHLASLSAPDSDRWLPILWAIDAFKSSQAADIREGDWTLAPVDEKSVPGSDKARAAFIKAMDNWDEAAADVAITGLVRSAPAHEIFELLCPYGMRDFREIGHKAIYISNSFRTLEVIGWRHAEPILRSVTYAILDRFGAKENPSKADLPADRPYRRNQQLVGEIRPGWVEGKVDADSTKEMLKTIRAGSAADAGEKALQLLNAGVSPQSLFDAYFAGAGELLMRSPGILSLHSTTFTNAIHYQFQHTRDEQARKMMLLQNASFLPLYRGNSKDKGLHADSLEPAELNTKGSEAVEEIFADVSKDKLLAARKMLAYLNETNSPEPVAALAQKLIFLKGRDSHDYKFSSAVLEDFHNLTPQWRNRFLAASLFNLKGSGDSTNGLVERIKNALS